MYVQYNPPREPPGGKKKKIQTSNGYTLKAQYTGNRSLFENIARCMHGRQVEVQVGGELSFAPSRQSGGKVVLVNRVISNHDQPPHYSGEIGREEWKRTPGSSMIKIWEMGPSRQAPCGRTLT